MKQHLENTKMKLLESVLDFKSNQVNGLPTIRGANSVAQRVCKAGHDCGEGKLLTRATGVQYIGEIEVATQTYEVVILIHSLETA